MCEKYYTLSFAGDKPVPGRLSNSSNESPGGTWTDPVTGMEFVWVPQGCFQMGSNSGQPNEKPVHEVCVNGFWIGKFEVTQGQWKKVMSFNPSYFKKGDSYPVEQVTWDDCKKFISKLNSQTGKTYALPTEAQWEYAARSGGKKEIYSGGNNVDVVAWHAGNSGGGNGRSGSTNPVGMKRANGISVFDMSGNVWEWCEDVYNENAYTIHDRKNPLITSGSSYRVLRGGCWLHPSWASRCACRFRYPPDNSELNYGFRLVLLSAHINSER